MSRSYASIVRGNTGTLSADAKEFVPGVKFHAFCSDCGAEAEVCVNGCDRPPIITDMGKRICGGCLYAMTWRMGSESMSIGIVKAADKKNDPKFKCRRCV